MKLEITRILCLAGAMGVASLAAAAWHEPSPQIISVQSEAGFCPLPPILRSHARMEPDSDLLLLMFGLSQGFISHS
ncbi:hypothetical protein [Pseudomonas sp. RIT-PI-AD]|uniref:hypothetical protein n=1 Tax=Pseudomonas sp. RIT-PI-AD TaxID=3035294 RepID=UPI0021D94CC6|nr:hypothetical protein [Pseudomonas sp. RIT-PI-AD]